MQSGIVISKKDFSPLRGSKWLFCMQKYVDIKISHHFVELKVEVRWDKDFSPLRGSK